MHGADAATPITLVENASRPSQRILETSLGALPKDLDAAHLNGPCLILLGLAPRHSAEALTSIKKEIAL